MHMTASKEHQIRKAYREAVGAAGCAVQKAVIVGFLLVEAKAAVSHGSFKDWIKRTLPEISYDTAHRWTCAAEHVAKLLKLQPTYGDGILLSDVLSSDPKDLPSEARAARTSFDEYITGKTIKELMGVVVDGDDASRISRAHNGRTLGGGGGDRKAWHKFIGSKLADVSSHMGHWNKFTPAQIEYTESRLVIALAKWPTPVLETLKKRLTEELKRR
jgi:hypothetical protein